jgi:hypothetical protein
MVEVPSLPAGPVRIVAIAGSIAFLAFGGVAGLLAVRRRWREAAWAALVLAFAVTTMLVGRAPGWHVIASALTLACALRNAVCLDATPRWLTAVATAAWITATIQAHLVFR